MRRLLLKTGGYLLRRIRDAVVLLVLLAGAVYAAPGVGGTRLRAGIAGAYCRLSGGDNCQMTGAVRSAVASGQNAFEVTVNGGRIDCGTGTSDYIASDNAKCFTPGGFAADNGGVALNATGLVFTVANRAISASVGPVVVNDQLEINGAAPTMGSCGTGPSVAGFDSAGKVTVGTGSVTTCTVNFSTAFPAAPACVVTGSNNALRYTATSTTTAMVITSSASMASAVISYVCLGL